MRTKIIFVLAVVMGLVTTVLFFNYMKQFDDVTVANENLTGVVAAKSSIKKNQRIDASMLEIKQVPKLSVHPQTVTAMDAAMGKFAVSSIEPGEVLLNHRVKHEKDEEVMVARKITEGFRAVSVGVNMVRSVSNLIEPEDMVDIIFTPEKVTGGPPQVSSLLLEKIRVLAVGRRMVEVSSEHPYVDYSSVTLEILPKDTVALVHAIETGTISLVLHGRIIEGPSPAK